MHKLNICLISYEAFIPPFHPPFHLVGGEGAYTAGLSNALLKLGHEIIALTTNKNEHDLYNENRFRAFFVRTINKPPLRLLSFYLRAKSMIREISKTTNLDIVHYTNDYCGPVISREEINRPIIVTMHHPYFAERKIWSDNVEKWKIKHPTYFLASFMKDMSARQTCKKVTKIIVTNRFTANGIINEYGIPPYKITIIPIAVDAKRFNPNIVGYDVREKWKIDSDPLVVFVGRLVQNKGLNYLIEAFINVLGDISDAKLIIAGEGPLRNKLSIMSKKLNLENVIKIVGRVPDGDLPKLYAAADLVVLPSLMEGSGIVLLEAMATSKPCVATTVGGVPELVVNGKTGIIVPPGDSSSLYKAICTVLEDKSLSRKLGEAGRQRVEDRYTWKIVAEKTTELYEQVLEIP